MRCGALECPSGSYPEDSWFDSSRRDVAYLTQAILEEEHGANLVERLTRPTGKLARTIKSATARVESALQIGGYTAAVPASVYAANASDCPEQIVELALRVWKRIAYTGSDLSIPDDQIRALDQELADVENGKLEIKGLARSVSRAPGGITASDGDPRSTSASARKQVFGRVRMGGY